MCACVCVSQGPNGPFSVLPRKQEVITAGGQINILDMVEVKPALWRDQAFYSGRQEKNGRQPHVGKQAYCFLHDKDVHFYWVQRLFVFVCESVKSVSAPEPTA